MENSHSQQASTNASVSSTSHGRKIYTNEDVVRIRPTTRKGDVWSNYDMCIMIDGVEKARCKKCMKFYNPGSNSTLRTHKSGCNAVSENDTSQGTIGADGQVFIFDNDAVRLDFTKFVIQQALPFNHFDNVKLTEIIKRRLQPRFDVFLGFDPFFFVIVCLNSLQSKMTGGLYENTRRQFSSNEDFTKKISHSVFVTNFPDYVNSRDLWNKCSVYGTVIDVFIPNKKSKAGKRFAFVRFIKVFNLDRLVKNLCTIWIGSYHLFANQVRYDRPQKPLNPNTNVPQKYGSKKDADHRNGSTGSHQKKGGVTSYVSVVNGVTPLVQPGNSLSSAPALVLDEECVVERDFSNCAMGRVKSFDFLRYQLHPSRGRGIRECYIVLSWRLVGYEVNQDFVSDERVVWLDIEGVPLYAWSRKSFDKIGNKWGEVLNIEDSYETSFGRKVYMVRAKELFTWTPSFESIKEHDYSSEDESVQGVGSKENKYNTYEKEEGLKEAGRGDLERVSLSHPPGLSPVDL
ncbi:RNA-directed DNA polymerase, eukaryota [Tanacetum coccineum]